MPKYKLVNGFVDEDSIEVYSWHIVYANNENVVAAEFYDEQLANKVLELLNNEDK